MFARDFIDICFPANGWTMESPSRQRIKPNSIWIFMETLRGSSGALIANIEL